MSKPESPAFQAMREELISSVKWCPICQGRGAHLNCPQCKGAYAALALADAELAALSVSPQDTNSLERK